MFTVVEVPAYEPLGYGDHIYISITKSGKTTRDTQIAIASLLGLRREDVGHAGLKDKNAVSTQTFSILMPADDPKEVAKIIESSLGVTVNWAKRHPKKHDHGPRPLPEDRHKEGGGDTIHHRPPRDTELLRLPEDREERRQRPRWLRPH